MKRLSDAPVSGGENQALGLSSVISGGVLRDAESGYDRLAGPLFQDS